MRTLEELATWLDARGVGSYLQSEEQMIIARQNPALPTSNTLWVQKKGDHWYVGTWLPSAYRVAKAEELGHICETLFRSSTQAMYTIDENLVGPLGLERLNDQEMEELGF